MNLLRFGNESMTVCPTHELANQSKSMMIRVLSLITMSYLDGNALTMTLLGWRALSVPPLISIGMMVTHQFLAVVAFAKSAERMLNSETASAFVPMATMPHNNVMHAKPDLRVFLKWMIAGSGSVITAVIQRRRLRISQSRSKVFGQTCRTFVELL